ncbi:MAG: hypothetical protein N2110_00430 [Flavobacteriales bacterium]|nr:hypothetical protein [Flavobacteriales bacterium]MCX7767476.1 hypothetical protein [Flavobacteriales bacterium]MDW8409612.1 hypothetical protein [Flavobacteriales bacterium]
MSGKYKSILVGARGLTGRLVLQKLLERDEFEKVVVLGRKSCQVHHPKLTEYITQFNDLDKYTFWPESDVLFCCIGTTMAKAGGKEGFRKVDYDIPVNLARYCALFNIEFYLMSSLGADPNSPNFYLKTKGETEKAVLEAGIPTVKIFRPAVLLGRRNELRPGEEAGRLFLKLIKPFLKGRLRRYTPINAAAVAEAMIVTFLSGDKSTQIIENDKILELSKTL